ncbi:MAG: cytochrome b [Methylocystaceae bacterium]|nr:cytochrome b [Methylocystaceae bacterium]
MAIRNTPEVYGSVSKTFHWLIFIGFIALYAIGFYMTSLPLGPEMFEKIVLHKSIGIVVLGLVVLRLLWRFFNPAPVLPDNMPPIERLGAHVSHIALYSIMIVMPLSGWAMSSAANFPISVFGWFTLPSLMAPSKPAVEFLKEFHEVMAWVILFLLTIHIAAALKHHFINKDNVLKRILPFHKGE